MKDRITTWLRQWRDWVNPIPLTAFLLVCLFSWYIIFGDQGLLTLRQLKQTERELQLEERHMQRRLSELQKEAERLADPVYLEYIIRQELGYVRPGETVFQFPNEERN